MRRQDYSRSDRDRHRSGSKRDRSPGISPSVHPSGELSRHKRSRGSSRDGMRDRRGSRSGIDKSKDVESANRREIGENMKNMVGAGVDGDILAKLAADLSAKVNKVEAEKLEAVEREMDSLGSKAKGEMREEDEKAEEEIRIRRQERLKKWREQKQREEESKTSKMSDDVVKGHETIESKTGSITMAKRKSSATESASLGSGDVKMVVTTTPTTIGVRKGGTILQLGGSRKPKVSALSAAWEADAEDEEEEEEEKSRDYRGITTTTTTSSSIVSASVALDTATEATSEAPDAAIPAVSAVKEAQKEEDPLDAFMTTLEKSDEIVEQDSIYDIGMGLEDGLRKSDTARMADVNALGSNTITLDELLGSSSESGKKAVWESDTGGEDSGIDEDETPEQKQSREEREEKEKAEFIEALRRHDAAGGRAVGAHKDEDDDIPLSKGRETQVEELGRMWGEEGDVMEEYERKTAEKDALQV